MYYCSRLLSRCLRPGQGMHFLRHGFGSGYGFRLALGLGSGQVLEIHKSIERDAQGCSGMLRYSGDACPDIKQVFWRAVLNSFMPSVQFVTSLG